MHHHDAVLPDADSERLVANRYRLLSVLGEGGMGTVWRAQDELLHREVAVKEVRATAELSAELSAQMYARLEREAWAAARISARGVVTVYDVAIFDGRPWIVMELVRGRSLADVISAEGPAPVKEAARIGVEVLAALTAAHAAGVLHRDVKPGNVLLADDGRVVLTDFGIASLEGDTALTMTGQIVGSPEYLAPERALGRTPGYASDLWSLGALLYTIVQGRSPFRRTTALATMRAVVDDELPPPHRAGPLTPVIEGLMRKDPEKRMTSEQAERELRAVAGGPAIPSEAHLVAGATAVTTAAVPAAGAVAAEGGAIQLSQETAAAAGSVPMPSFDPPLGAAGFGPVQSLPGTGAVPDRKRGIRRTGYLIGAVAAALILVGGGLAYALAGPGGSGSRANASEPVSVTVAGGATTYDGICPSADGQEPWFTATFTTARPPVQVSYRWVSSNGTVVDPQWRTLTFRDGDPTTKEETVRLSTYAQQGTLSSAMAVEIRSPFNKRSNSVPFSMTCRPNAQ